MEDLEPKLQRISQINRVFTPSAPISERSAFSGRIDQIMQITGALPQPGRHIVIYGERGVGKTSLANVLSGAVVTPAGGDEFKVVRVTCNIDDTFESLWSNIFQDVEEHFNEGPPSNISPDSIRRLLSQLIPPIAIVIDEYDRFDDEESLSLMSDIIKALSDHAVETKLILVGVSDSIEQLIGEHASVRRALEEVALPRMSVEEIASVPTNGFDSLNMTIEEPAVRRVQALSEGLPTYAHHLSLKAGTRAIQDDRNIVTSDDIEVAALDLVRDPHSSRAAYQQAVQSPRPDNQYAQVLAACAMAEKDRLGYFKPAAVQGPLSRIMGKPYKIPAFSRHLSEFIREERGFVLERRGEPRKYRYRFRDPLMQPFAVLAAIEADLVPDSFKSDIFESEPSGRLGGQS